MKKRRKRALSAKIQAWHDYSRAERDERIARKMRLPSFDRAPPALTRSERLAAVEHVMPILAAWSASPLEHEAACIHGMRIGLCLDGKDWGASQMAAAEVVAAAFDRLGVVRPTWAQGQPEFNAAYDHCVQCARALDDEQLGHHDRFCSPECGRAFNVAASARREIYVGEVSRSARRVIEVAHRPTCTCEQCGKTFKARGNRAAGEPLPRYCSDRCAGEAQRSLPSATCANPACGQPFRIRSTDRIDTQKFCCHDCYVAMRRAQPTFFEREYVCDLCAKPFRSASSHPRYCGDTCNVQASAYRSGRIRPKRLTAKVFDFFVAQPHNNQVARAHFGHFAEEQILC